MVQLGTSSFLKRTLSSSYTIEKPVGMHFFCPIELLKCNDINFFQEYQILILYFPFVRPVPNGKSTCVLYLFVVFNASSESEGKAYRWTLYFFFFFGCKHSFQHRDSFGAVLRQNK